MFHVIPLWGPAKRRIMSISRFVLTVSLIAFIICDTSAQATALAVTLVDSLWLIVYDIACAYADPERWH